jgi:DNA-binding MarR family transcriptional regulator
MFRKGLPSRQSSKFFRVSVFFLFFSANALADLSKKPECSLIPFHPALFLSQKKSPSGRIIFSKLRTSGSFESKARAALSKAQLEVLAIISYRGPISRTEIEAIRGVNCSYTLRALLLRELIERDGNPENLRGYVYTLSNQFLLSLGVATQEELPDFQALSQDKRLTEVIATELLAESSPEKSAEPQTV